MPKPDDKVLGGKPAEPHDGAGPLSVSLKVPL